VFDAEFHVVDEVLTTLQGFRMIGPIYKIYISINYRAAILTLTDNHLYTELAKNAIQKAILLSEKTYSLTNFVDPKSFQD
jgi:hypothetical protein